MTSVIVCCLHLEALQYRVERGRKCMLEYHVRFSLYDRGSREGDRRGMPQGYLL